MTETILDPGALPVGPYDHKGPSWWGVLALIATEGALFGYLLFSYYYFDVQLPHSWRPAQPPDLKLPVLETVVLLLSSLAVWQGERSLRRGRRGACVLGLLAGVALGAAFVWLQLLEWKSKPFTLQSGPYGSIYFTVAGFHVAHAVAGLIALLMVLLWTALGYFDAKRNAAVANAAAYWLFVNAVWLLVFCTFDITPYLW